MGPLQPARSEGRPGSDRLLPLSERDAGRSSSSRFAAWPRRRPARRSFAAGSTASSGGKPASTVTSRNTATLASSASRKARGSISFPISPPTIAAIPAAPRIYLGLPQSLNLHNKLHYTEVDLVTVSNLPAATRAAWKAADTSQIPPRVSEPVIPNRFWNWSNGYCGRDEEEQTAPLPARTFPQPHHRHALLVVRHPQAQLP